MVNNFLKKKMKNIITIILVLFSLKSVAQSPILDLHTNTFDGVTNTYYKDIEGFYKQFVGTWEYTDGVQTIRMRFEKREMFPSDFNSKNYYVDYLVGEAQYAKNGLYLLNSFNNLNLYYQKIEKYSMYSLLKVGYNWYPRCEECPLDVQRLEMKYDEATNDDWGLSRYLIMRKVVENGVQKIKIQFVFDSSSANMNKNNLDAASTTQDFTIPFGNYTLTKVP